MNASRLSLTNAERTTSRNEHDEWRTGDGDGNATQLRRWVDAPHVGAAWYGPRARPSALRARVPPSAGKAGAEARRNRAVTCGGRWRAGVSC